MSSKPNGENPKAKKLLQKRFLRKWNIIRYCIFSYIYITNPDVIELPDSFAPKRIFFSFLKKAKKGKHNV